MLPFWRFRTFPPGLRFSWRKCPDIESLIPGLACLSCLETEAISPGRDHPHCPGMPKRMRAELLDSYPPPGSIPCMDKPVVTDLHSTRPNSWRDEPSAFIRKYYGRSDGIRNENCSRSFPSFRACRHSAVSSRHPRFSRLLVISVTISVISLNARSLLVRYGKTGEFVNS